jgi:hypothetical protein
MYAADGTVGQSGLWIHDEFVGANAGAGTSAGIGPSLADRHVEIALFKDGGTFKVPVLINGAIVLDFIVDSGAADVNIPADVAMTLIRTERFRMATSSVRKTLSLPMGQPCHPRPSEFEA